MQDAKLHRFYIFHCAFFIQSAFFIILPSRGRGEPELPRDHDLSGGAVRVKSAFARLCVAMNQQLVPVLGSAGFSSSDTPFRREAVRYEFRRRRAEGADVLAVLFNRRREALFSVQLYVESREGLAAFVAAGGALHVAGLSAVRMWWPMGPAPFRANPTFLDRLRGHRVLDVARPIQQFVALLPHAENWFRDRTRSRYIVDGRLAFPRPA